MFYYIFFALALAGAVALFFSKLHQRENAIIDKVAKITVVCWMALTFLNLFLPDGFVLRSYDDISSYVSGENIWYAIFRWASDVAFVVLPIAIFFKKELFNKITAYFLVAISLANAILYFKHIGFLTSTKGAGLMPLRFLSQGAKDFLINKTFRSIYFGLLCYLQLMLSVFVTLRSFKSLKPNKQVKSILKGVGAFLLILCAIIPIYVPQYLFKGYSMIGAGNIDNFKMGTFFHIVWIVLVVLEGVGLTLFFKKKSYEDRFIVVLIMSLALIMQYHQMFTCIGEITAHRMPFQLCNMAGFFILLMLLTKSEKVYHFTIVINSVGAIIAMVICDTTPYGIAYVMNVHYVAEHTNVILVPILCATLGIFAPLKKSDIKHFLVGFTAYFLFVLVLGGIFTGLKETLAANGDYWNCNYLFMFNKAETVKIVGFIGPLFDIKITLFNFFTLNLVQLVVYVVFSLICTGAFFLIKFLLRKNTVWEKDHQNGALQE